MLNKKLTSKESNQVRILQERNPVGNESHQKYKEYKEQSKRIKSNWRICAGTMPAVTEETMDKRVANKIVNYLQLLPIPHPIKERYTSSRKATHGTQLWLLIFKENK